MCLLSPSSLQSEAKAASIKGDQRDSDIHQTLSPPPPVQVIKQFNWKLQQAAHTLSKSENESNIDCIGSSSFDCKHSCSLLFSLPPSWTSLSEALSPPWPSLQASLLSISQVSPLLSSSPPWTPLWTSLRPSLRPPSRLNVLSPQSIRTSSCVCSFPASWFTTLQEERVTRITQHWTTLERQFFCFL